MLQRIMRMLEKRSPEFAILFFFQTSVIFMWESLFLFNAVCITLLCVLYIPLVEFVVPTLPKWYRDKLGNVPKFNAIQAVLCATYTAASWAPILWKLR